MTDLIADNSTTAQCNRANQSHTNKSFFINLKRMHFEWNHLFYYHQQNCSLTTHNAIDNIIIFSTQVTCLQ